MNRFNEGGQFNRNRFDRRCDNVNWILWGFCPPRRCGRRDFDNEWESSNRRREGRWSNQTSSRESEFNVRNRREREFNDLDQREFELRNETRQGEISQSENQISSRLNFNNETRQREISRNENQISNRLNFNNENGSELFNSRLSSTPLDVVGLANITTSGLVDGLTVPAGGRIPLTTLRVNDDNLITLNDNTIRFNRRGLYKIDFVVDTYTQNPTANEQIALGFKRVIDSYTLFTAGMRITTPSNQIVGTGVIRVNNVRELYELINLNTNSIRLLSFRGETVLTSANVVNMSITYLND